MKAMGASVIAFGMTQFKRINILKRRDEIESWLQTDTVKEHIMDESVLEMAFEEIIDAVKITICFENYMKGVLLSHGFLVNELNKDIQEVASLSKAQRSRPIHINELLQVVHFENTDNVFYTLKGVKRNTLSFGVMLSENYQKEIGLPHDILKIISTYNHKRNNLHFYQNSEMQISKTVMDNVHRLDDFVDQNILPFFRALDAELKNGS